MNGGGRGGGGRGKASSANPRKQQQNSVATKALNMSFQYACFAACLCNVLGVWAGI